MGLIWLIPIFCIIILGYSYCLRKWMGEKKKLWKIFVINLIVFGVIFGFQSAIIYTIQKEESEKQEKFRKRMLQAYVERETDPKELQEMITEARQEIFDSSREEAEKWAKDFVASLSKKKEALRSLENAEKQLGEKRMLWIPAFVQYTIQVFDDKVSALQIEGMKSEIKKEDYKPIVESGSPDNKQYVVRTVKFQNGCVLEVKLSPAVKDEGVIRPELLPRFNFHGLTNTGKAVSFTLKPSTGGVDIVAVRPQIFDLRYPPTTDPLSNKNFKEELSGRISKLIEWIFVRS